MQPVLKQISVGIILAALALASVSCGVSAKSGAFFGQTEPPARNILRYVTGDEPQSLDPQISSGQPEQRIYMALYEGLVEYDPKTMEPIPAIAERWDVNNDLSEFVFHLRKNARWSNGAPITANDFVYSLRRGLSPELASGNASLAYYIKYAQSYNSKAVFVWDQQTKQFLSDSDFSPAGGAPLPLSQTPLKSLEAEFGFSAAGPKPPSDTPFHQFMHSPPRLTLPGDEQRRNKIVASNPKLQAAVAGKVFVPVKGVDIGIEAVDDYTLRISLSQSAPYFTGLLANPFFRLVPRTVVEEYRDQWTETEHIVTCGPFKLKSWQPYHELVVERDPMYWDAAKVQLEEIHFYPMADLPTIMNLYKVGEVDAVGNHSVPNAWLDVVRSKQDYMDGAEAGIIYIRINVTKPPMNDVRVRRAFNMAIDKVTYAKSKRITKPLFAFTPEGIFTGYPRPRGDGFDPLKARQLLGEAGYPVRKRNDGSYECSGFPVDQVEYSAPTTSSNKTMAEFMQAQWQQNLGITVPLRMMEGKTFLSVLRSLDYKGFAFGGWSADYMDPFTFLSLFSTPGNDNGSGWWDQKYVDLLDEANRTLDKQQRYELLARAEKYMLDAQPVMPIETPALNWVKKPYVKGMYPNAGSLFPWKFVYLERDPVKWDYGKPRLAE